MSINKKSIILVLALLSGICNPSKAEQVLYVNNQSEYETISSLINHHLRELPQGASETITVYFAGGTYKYDNQLTYAYWDRPNVSLHFTARQGETVNFVSDGNEYTPAEATQETATHYFVPLKGHYSRGEMFVDQNFNIVPISDSGILSEAKINKAASIQETIRNVHGGNHPVDYIRFKLPQELSFLRNKDASFFKNSLICMKIWYGHRYGTIDKTDDEYIYIYYNRSSMFEAVENNPNWASYKGNIKFYITNITGANNQPERDKVLVADGGIYIPKGVTKLYECKRQMFAWIYENDFKEIKFSNLNFLGASYFDYERYYEEEQNRGNLLTYDGVSYYRATLISATNTENLVIDNCVFKNIGSNGCVSSGISGNYTGAGFVFQNNHAYNIGGKVVQSYMPNTVIDNNTVHNAGLFFSDRPDVITVTGRNYRVTNNRISDFTGNGITIGYNVCTLMPNHPVSGIVEGNELFFTSEFLNNRDRYTLEDTHAIYFLNHQDNSTCRGNVIHDFAGHEFTDGTGRCNNKAIAVDCGGYNIHVTGNLVFNVLDVSFSTDYVGNGPNATTNIVVENNVFFAPCRIIGNPSYPVSSKIGSNYMATDINRSLPALQDGFRNVLVGNDDIVDKEASVKDGKCYLTKDFSSLNLSPFVKQWLESSSVSNENLNSNNHIWSYGKAVYIKSSIKQKASIYAIDGRLVRTVNIHDGENMIPVNSGFYVIKLDDTFKTVYVN